MFCAYFSHFMISFIIKMDSTLVLVLILPCFALSKLSLGRRMLLVSHKCSIVVVKVLSTLIRQRFSS